MYFDGIMNNLKFVNKLLIRFIYYLFLSKMKPESIINLVLSLTISRVYNYKDMILRAESNLLKKINILTVDQIANSIYAFSKSNQGKCEGSERFYNLMEEKVLENFSNFSSKQLSRIFYAFTCRNVRIK